MDRETSFPVNRIMELGKRYDELDAKGRDRTPDEQEEYVMLKEAYGEVE